MKAGAAVLPDNKKGFTAAVFYFGANGLTVTSVIIAGVIYFIGSF